MTTVRCAAFLIDMDGVLVDSTPAVARVWSRWAREHGFDPELTTQRAHGRPSLATIQDLLPEASPETHQRENAWLEREEIADVADIVALPGTLELLRGLGAGQFAVVTSATRALAEVRLGVCGLLKFVPRMITSGDIRRGKPDPEPYHKGAALLQVPAVDCVVIEDAAAGVRSGKGAGARVMALRTTTPDAESQAAGADWVVDDCASVRLVSSAQNRIEFDLVDSPKERRVPKMR